MAETTADSVRSQQRSSGFRIAVVCGAFVALQVMVMTLLPPSSRAVTAVLLTMVTIVGAIVAAMEVSFKRAAKRAAEAGTPAGTPSGAPGGTPALELPRRPRERVSPLIQRAYYLARRDAPAWHIAGTCEIPEAFAVLIIDDVRRSATRRGRAARDASSRQRDDRGKQDGGRKPKNPPAS